MLFEKTLKQAVISNFYKKSVCGKFETSKNCRNISLYEEKYKSYFNLQINSWEKKHLGSKKVFMETLAMWNGPRANEERYIN